MLRTALTAFATFLVTVAPLKVAPVFLTLTRHLDTAAQRRVAIRGTVLAGIIMGLFGVAGDDALRILEISLSGVRVGGGVLLLLLAIQLVSGREPGGGADPAAPAGDIAVFPLAMPMIAGPATITATIVLASELKNDAAANVTMFAMMALVLLLTLACLLAAASVDRVIGETGMSVVSRILGILLAALAADLILAGLRDSGVFR